MGVNRRSEGRKSFGFLMRLMADSSISPRDLAETARISAHAIDRHAEVKLDFPDLDLALELRDSKRQEREFCQAHVGPFTKAHEPELERLSERVHSIVRSIKCPDWYGKNNHLADMKWIAELKEKQKKTPLTPDEDNEEARAAARVAAFAYQLSQTPEELARSRKLELEGMRFRRMMSADEESELERLRAQYPSEDIEPTPWLQALEAARKKWTRPGSR